VHLRPEGFEVVDAILKSDGVVAYIVEGLSGIGKTFAVESALAGRRGTLIVSFKDMPSANKNDPVNAAMCSALGIGLDVSWNAPLKAALEAHRAAHPGEHAVVVLDDIDAAFATDPLTARLMISSFLEYFDNGLVSLVLMGSEPVKQLVERNNVTGRSRLRLEHLEPIAEEPMRAALTSMLVKERGRTEAEAAPEVGDVLALVGTRVKDVSDVLARNPTSTLYTLVTSDTIKLSSVVAGPTPAEKDAVSSEAWTKVVNDFLPRLLAEEPCELRGPEVLKWQDMLVHLVRKNVVRVDTVLTPSADSVPRVRFHHKSMEAAARWRFRAVKGASSHPAARAQLEAFERARAAAGRGGVKE